jgi:hypothetical protein
MDGKSASFRIDVDGEWKLWVVNPEPYLEMGCHSIYKYLGVKFKSLGVCRYS